MSNVFVQDSSLTAIANAIREKNGSSNTYKPSQMASAISSIPTGITPSGTKNITENGTYDVTNFASALVNVASGGGLPSNVYYEEVTLYSDTDTLIVNHNTGKVPVMALSVATNPYTARLAYSQMLLVALKYNIQDSDEYLRGHTFNNYQGRLSAITNSNMGTFAADETSVSFGSRGGSYVWKAGVTYSILLLFEE